jgi:hypothetical protein
VEISGDISRINRYGINKKTKYSWSNLTNTVTIVPYMFWAMAR